MSVAVKFGFKGVLKMPFNMFLTLLEQITLINDEHYKSLAFYLRAARFADDKKFKEIMEKKPRIRQKLDKKTEAELIARLNKW